MDEQEKFMEVGRAPYGARGLKCNVVQRGAVQKVVAPRMGRVD